MLIPDYVLYAMDKLKLAGYECYLVGGCVRDALMSVTPHDYDLTTSALPNEMQVVFAHDRVIETGLKHGTLTVLSDGNPIEITTYRIDGEYDDNRHPREVNFTRNLRDDLSRRDFTVNAMAMSSDGEIVDLFGGREDLADGVIRCVGDPKLRFGEDGLRIMRALRFASTLGFAIDADTASAIDGMSYLLCSVSAERIREELIKLICGIGAAAIFDRFAIALHEVLPELPVDRIRCFSKSMPQFSGSMHVRLASLIFLSDAPVSTAKAIAERLKFSTADKSTLVTCTCVMTEQPTEKVTLAVYANALGYDLLIDALTAIGSESAVKASQIMRQSKTPISVAEIDIDGNDVKNLGAKGAAVGELLQCALNAVINGECENIHDRLIEFIKGKMN